MSENNKAAWEAMWHEIYARKAQQTDDAVAAPHSTDDIRAMTPAELKNWIAANGAAILEAQKKARDAAARRAMDYAQMRVLQGASIQDIGDSYFRDCVNRKYWPAVYVEVARELFRQIGWVDRKAEE
ncbi:TPA: hypothetical protein QDC20_003634 [Burkholderia aenigmatica]|uniref:hypothetical protein n=1 Tax=Burkholderia sp. AU45251 TaxID=3059204 RepID=UPI002652C84F|nr:hypothetical protein [Burkholderia sp. AU45251]HDR9482817.1 hypothetical protein [Burkholderia aenigmatica]MDN7519499.1 hypothetical protein [Burkholderia sp. AU45251]HDR9513764.1 hypothetical protein [Burkholderia aenigmatica]HDR9591155.1 hypothetical protein [Burkholderia aenigmatica]HDR9599137.1 hypothetical protein [Burkholderia aenigmatica]